MTKISIAVCTHNEGDYLERLMPELTHFVERDPEFELVIIDDHSTESHTLDAISNSTVAKVYQHALASDFAAHKNFMTEKCSGDWILNLDADERLSMDLLYNLPQIIDANEAIEAYWLPRVNTVDGLTLKHVQQYGWVLTKMDEFITIKFLEPNSPEYQLLDAYGYILDITNGYVRYHQPIVCWPDCQMRLYKNSPNIRWEGKVHERLTGFENFSTFPLTIDYAILHHKSITRQERQNSYYETIAR